MTGRADRQRQRRRRSDWQIEFHLGGTHETKVKRG